VYTNREIPKKDIKGAQEVIRSQFAVHIVVYIAFLPLILFLLSDTFIPLKYIMWFGGMLLLEHITFEIVRFLIALQHPLCANLIILSRSFLWTTAFLITSYISPSFLSIKSLLIFWVSGLSMALLISIGLLFKVKVLPFETLKIDIPFIKAAIRGSFIFLMSSICSNTIEFSNRYFLMYHRSSFEVGVYSFFQNIVNLMDVFIYTAVVMILLPKLIEAKSKQEDFAYKNKLCVMQGGIFYGTVFLAAALFLFIGPFLSFISKGEMVDNISIFYLLLIGAIVLSLSLIGHYTLYIHHGERVILASTFTGAVVNIILNTILIPSYGLTGAALSTIVSTSVMGGLKVYFAQRLEPIRLGMILYSPAEFIKSSRAKGCSFKGMV